jgi:hypothetical protein
LELKIAQLERVLASNGASQVVNPSQHLLVTTPTFINNAETAQPKDHAQQDGRFPPSHLGNALGFLSLCAASEPYYVGSSTGFSLANLVQAAVYDRLTTAEDKVPSPASPAVSPEAVRNLPSGDDRPFSCHRPRPTTKPATVPADELGAALLSAYLNKVHSVYPFLDREKLLAMHEARKELSKSSAREHITCVAKLHLVYGIGARHLQLLGTSHVIFDRSLPEAHFTAAAAGLSSAFELRSTESIEMLLLLSLFSLHSPSGPGAWQLTGMATRLCVELGMHRRGKSGDVPQDQRRRALFWSCLILERKVSMTLGRPFSLADTDIDAEVSNYMAAMAADL